MNVKLNNKGFSLVELMVVVAIIGILAAVAVPQFSKFQAKSRQSEAKSSLTALYTAEKGFFAEYTGYATAFQAIGYSPTGDVLYNVGFSNPCANWGACAPSYNGPVGAGAFSSAGTVAAGAGGAANATACTPYGTAPTAVQSCAMKQAGTLGGAIGPLGLTAGTASTIAFTAQARAQVYASAPAANFDAWTINENKIVQQTTNGIP